MSFTFNGENCETMGLYVEKYPVRPFPARKQNIYQIHGKSGDLIVDENAFSNVTQNYDVYILGGSQGFQTRAKAIANWLLSPAGYKTLTDSYDPTVYRMARFVGGIEFLNSLNKYGRATIAFDCCPQRYPIGGEELTGVLGDTLTVLSQTTLMKGLPFIQIDNWVANDTSGSIETDSLTIAIPVLDANQAHIYIDFETHAIYNDSGVRIGATVTGTWNPVGSGENIVTTKSSGSTSPAITIQTRRWYL